MIKTGETKLEKHNQEQTNLAESAKEGYRPKMAVLPMMMMILTRNFNGAVQVTYL